MMLLKGKRIFYVEDNVQNRSLVQLILERQGAIIGFERWGDEGDIFARLDIFKPIDLILLDLMFPNNVTGYDIFAAIRAQSQYAGIPIVAISAADPAIEMNKARAQGFAGYISKPIDMLEFPKQIYAILQGESVWYGG